MISKKVEKAFNGQINAELYSGYLYLSMAACFEAANLPGFAHWMEVQANEEFKHAMKFYKHIHERLGRVTLEALEKPPANWDTPLAAFEDAFKHEQKVTGMINDLVALAAEERDHAAGVFLQWFVAEQVEEEASADRVVQQLKMIGDAKQGLFMMDRAMAARE